MKMFKPSFKIGQSVSNKQIMSEFVCKNSGGIRYSTTTNSIVLIANHNFGLYKDRLVSSTFHYTGEGQQGDQTMTRGNKRLNSARFGYISVHLFEHFPGESGYRYSGPVLVGEPHQETQRDINNRPRLVWIFPLTFIE